MISKVFISLSVFINSMDNGKIIKFTWLPRTVKPEVVDLKYQLKAIEKNFKFLF